MKRGGLILSLAISIILMLSSATALKSCSDSDVGTNYSLKGTTKGYTYEDEYSTQAEDSCWDNNVGKVYSCTGQDCFISENYCDGYYVAEDLIACSGGCQNGACSSAFPTPIPPTPIPITKKCSDFGYTSGTLGNSCNSQNTSYDLSGCYNKTSSCKDYDNGKSYYNFSEAVVSDSYIYGKNCGGGGTGGGGGSGKSDYCNNSILTEMICVNNAIATDTYTCPKGCYNGACILGTTAICVDSDELVETKEINSGSSKILAGLNVKVESTSSTNFGFAAKLIVSKESSSNSKELILSSLENNATGKIELDDYYYKIELLSASSTSATVRVTSYRSYYVKGAVTTRDEAVEDSCKSDSVLLEGTCEEAGGKSIEYTCPNGCEDGACARSFPPQPNVCNSLLDYLSSVSEIYSGYLFSQKDDDDGSQYNSEIGDNITTASYLFENKEKGGVIYVSTITTQSKNIALTEWFQRIKEEMPISGDWIQSQQVYLLKDRDQEAILWFNENTVVIIVTGVEYGGYGGYNKIITNVDSFIASIQDNEFESLFDYSSENYQVIRKIALDLLPKCPSVISESCLSQWERKVEPSVCPEYGTQTIIVRDRYRCTDKIIKQTKTCSPRICSGCYIPRWLGYNFGYETEDNICIPYTIRMAYEDKQDADRLYTDESLDEVILTCLNDYTAKLNLISTNFNKEYILTEGSEYTIEEDYFGEEIRFIVKKINCLEGQRNYADITLLESFNGYCDIDGLIKEQKKKDSQGSWAKCQNNYECDSNLCSGGECVEVNDAIKEASTFKGLFIRVFCRLAHIFNEENYNVCIGDYLGYSPALDDWTAT